MVIISNKLPAIQQVKITVLWDVTPCSVV